MTYSSEDVTVVTCAYNAAPYIDTALASVAAQTARPGKVIVVDDGSSDDTVARARGWETELPVEVVVLDENGGAGNARKVAVEQAPTALLAILDADDYWLPDHLETMVQTYASAGGLITARDLWWVPGVGLGKPDGRYRDVPPPPQQMKKIIEQCFLSIGNLFSREDCLRAGNFRAIRAEDWDLWIRMIRTGVRVTRAPHATFLYRMHQSSQSFGLRVFDESLPVVEHAVAEAETPEERRWAEASLRRWRASKALATSYELAGSGQAGKARVSAARALRGDRRTIMRAMFMAALPRKGAEIHHRLLHDLSRRVDA
jgi:glycosyltransferase involved in cell wall biosynthesis